MMIGPEEWLLQKLKGPPFDAIGPSMSREEAYAELKAMTGVDFGYDVESWERWLKDNGKILRTRRKNDRPAT